MRKITLFAILAFFSTQIFSQNSNPISITKAVMAFSNTLECNKQAIDADGNKLSFKGVSFSTAAATSGVGTLSVANFKIKDTVPEKYIILKMNVSGAISDKYLTTQDQLVVKIEGDDFDLVGAAKGRNTTNHFNGCIADDGQQKVYVALKYNKDYVDGTISKVVLDVFSKEAADWNGLTNAGAPSELSNKFEFTLNVSNTPLSNNTLEAYNFNYAPNPAKNSIRLNAQEAIQNVSFYSSLGKNILNTTLNTNSDTIDISSLNSGVYLMQVTIDSATATYKIVKE